MSSALVPPPTHNQLRKNGKSYRTPVAVKVQYPGVAQAIDSDIQSLLSLISVLAILPPGLFGENIAKHMKVELELGQECNYKKEGDCGLRMKRILAQYPKYHVTAIYQELCTEQAGAQGITMHTT